MRNLPKIILYILFLGLNTSVFSQVKTDTIKPPPPKITYNPLSPSKAAFYSAVLPGAGQIYNNRYWWQLPLIYGGLGASIYYYNDNNKGFKRYRTAFKRRKAGLPDEFDGTGEKPLISEEGLKSAQRQTRKNRDLSLLSAILTYTLQIVEASVTAHLLQFDDSDELTFQPTPIQKPIQTNSYEENLPSVGLSLKYTF